LQAHEIQELRQSYVLPTKKALCWWGPLEMLGSPPLYPGADPNVIAVTSVGMDDHLFPGANRGGYIAVAAPGVDTLVLAPNNTYQLTSGTSVPSAFVSGVAALLVSLNPSLTPNDIRRILIATAKRLGPSAQFGAGLVDPLTALRLVSSRSEMK